MKYDQHLRTIMDERFGHDTLVALATHDPRSPYPAVRTVDAFFTDGAFYVVTHLLSGKMQQILADPHVAISGDWLTARGIGKSLGHFLLPENQPLADKLRTAFAAWLDNGHTDLDDPNTIILEICLTDAVLFHQGTRYDIDFA